MRLADLRSLAIIAMTLITIAPAAADENDAQLRRGLLGFFRGAETLRIDAVPDLYEGGYARISVYAKRARLAEGGLLVDEAWVRLRGVTLSVPHFREGTFRVVSVRDAAIYLRISVRSLEQYFIAGNPWDDIRLWSEGGYLFARGTVPVIGIPTRVEMKGYFAVEGTHEIFFYVESLRVNWLPLPEFLLRNMERQYNPVIDQKTWPVIIKLRSIRLSKEDLVATSEPDPGVCGFCGPIGSSGPP